MKNKVELAGILVRKHSSVQDLFLSHQISYGPFEFTVVVAILVSKIERGRLEFQ